MLNTLKNNYLRMFKRLPMTLALIFVTLLSMLLGVYISTQQVKAHVAVVYQKSVTEQFKNKPLNTHKSKYWDISVVSKEPSLSSLLLQKYDAFIVFQGKGTNYTIKTLRNNSFKNTLKKLIADQSTSSLHLGTSRNMGETITGFMLMFLLLSIFSMLFTLSDDKEKGMLTRLTTTPMKLSAYLAAHILYAFTTMLPSYIALVILQIRRVNIGLTLPQYALVYLCISVFGIPLALWFITIFQSGDDATLFGNSILILSTVLSGAFFSINNNNSIFKNFVSCLPQKQILNFVDNLHNGTAVKHPYPIIYVLASGIILFSMAIMNLRFQARKV